MAIDATGKVKPRELIDSLLEQDAVQISRSKDAAAKAKSKVVTGDVTQDAGTAIDKITLNAARSIQNGIDPLVMMQERADKVSKLKEMIESGEYKSDSQQVARAFGQEVVSEILLNPAAEEEDGTDIF